MYYPYLRGRQNELLCLRELLENGKLGKKIVPVIEPVRFSSTFFSTLSKFIEMNRDVIVIQNPKVGKFDKEFTEMRAKTEREGDTDKKKKLQETLEVYMEILKNEHILAGYINDAEMVSEFLKKNKDIEDAIVINRELGNYEYYDEYGEELVAKLTFIPNDMDFKDDVSGEVAVIEDGYKKAKRNIDYLEQPDEIFSRNHVVYKKRGYCGFCDYSIVGSEYEESGFAPLAIAIHLVYFGKKDVLRIHHFVSESNENISDPARKFEEAMNHLVDWENFDVIPKTTGLNNLLSYYYHGRFPGLGVIKKYSLMHHLEIINDYLGDE